MDREFIPYELALELKQLGFDEPCLAWFSDRNIRIVGVEGCVVSSLPINSNFNEDDEFVSAPTYSQAFRWFREKHKLIAGIFPNNHSLQDNVSYIGYVGKFKKGNVEVYETYEEAELGCLRDLIKLVKENENKIS